MDAFRNLTSFKISYIIYKRYSRHQRSSSSTELFFFVNAIPVVCKMCHTYHTNKEHIRKGIAIRTTDQAILTGYLHSIDPESGTHALLTSQEVHLLPATTIVSIKPAQLPEDVPTQINLGKTATSGIEKGRLVAGLRERHIDLEVVDQDIHIFGGLAVVKPPYGLESVRCVNENVLMRVRKVVGEIVEDCGNS